MSLIPMQYISAGLFSTGDIDFLGDRLTQYSDARGKEVSEKKKPHGTFVEYYGIACYLYLRYTAMWRFVEVLQHYQIFPLALSYSSI